LQADLESEQQRRSAADAERDRLLVERDSICQQLASLSSFVQPRPSGGAGPPRQPSNYSSPAPSPASTPTQPSSNKRDRSPSEEPPSSHKRPRSSSGSSVRPIQIDSDDDIDDEDDREAKDSSDGEYKNDGHSDDGRRSDQGSRSPPDQGRTQSSGARSRDGNNSPSSSSSDSSSDGSGGGTGSRSAGYLSDNALSRLPATVIRRDQWIPGYRRPQHFVQRDVAPWSVAETQLISVRSLTVDTFFRDWSCPLCWLFPVRQPRPRRSRWNPELITEANVRALYNAEPWTAMQTPVIPHSFDLVGWFAQFALQYTSFEDDHV
jgi:hypothetical protein